MLSGRSVEYAPWQLIADDLDYDFSNYDPKTAAGVRDGSREALAGIVRFTADIWQVHPFVEGNTRTVAVFVVMTLRNLGFEIEDAPFEKDSLFFRNALVRTNFSSMSIGVETDASHLEKFFENLLMGERHMLDSCDLYCKKPYQSDKRPSQTGASARHEDEHRDAADGGRHA